MKPLFVPPLGLIKGTLKVAVSVVLVGFGRPLYISLNLILYLFPHVCLGMVKSIFCQWFCFLSVFGPFVKNYFYLRVFLGNDNIQMLSSCHAFNWYIVILNWCI